MTIIEAVLKHSKNLPDRTAVIAGDGELSYRELSLCMGFFALRLKERGLKPGDPVIIAGMQNALFTVMILGTLMAGGVIVPVEKNIVPGELENIKKAVGAKLIFDEREFKNFDLENMKKSPASRSEIYKPDENDVSDILFTTGTTGTPEGIIHTHKSHYATAENILSCIDMPESNVALIAAPLNHSYGLRRFYANMVHGSSAVISDGILPLDNFFKTLEAYKVTSMAMNPSAFSILLKFTPEEPAKYYKNLVYIELGGSAAIQSDIKRFMRIAPGVKIYNIYGSTEAGTMTGFDNALHIDRIGCIGIPNINSHIMILDENMKAVSGSGEANKGFLAVKSPIIMKGYLNKPELTASVLKDGIYITKDVVYRDEEGFYYFVGRESDIISVGGIKIAPDEIENAAKDYPGVIDCACVGKADNMAGYVPVLFLKTDETFDKTNIYKHLSLRLDPWKCPKDIRLTNSIPRTFNGKLIRFKLREML